MRSLVALFILGATLLIVACNSTTSSNSPSVAAPSVETSPATSPELSPEASPS